MSSSEKYETARNVPVKDSGEIYDYVVRRGPVSYDKICQNTSWMAPDDIYRCLDRLRDAGLVKKIPGDLDKHGTTRDLWTTADSAPHRTKNKTENDQ